MKAIRMLIVEDEPKLLELLKQLYREIFGDHGFTSVTIEQANSAAEARSLARSAADHPYDLVSLDVNLGDRDTTGLDVLGSLNRFQSAWMVSLLTGVETDETIDATMGKTKGEGLRKRLRRDAYAKFPAERLLVVEKPSSSMASDDSERLLKDRVCQICLIYEEISRSRYIFRPIEVVSLERVSAPKGKKAPRKFIESSALHWQIRFNCGDIRTLPDRAGMKTIHHLLSMDREESLTPEEALVIEPKNEKGVPTEEDQEAEDPVAQYFQEQGIDWEALDEAEQEKLIAAALSLRFKRYVELREYQDEEDLSADEADELDRLVRELGPLKGAAEMAYRRLAKERDNEVDDDLEEISAPAAIQDGLNVAGGNYERVGEGRRGVDSPEAQTFRARWSRTKKFLRENGYAELAQHLEDYVSSTGASWSYNPPGEVEWTT